MSRYAATCSGCGASITAEASGPRKFREVLLDEAATVFHLEDDYETAWGPELKAVPVECAGCHHVTHVQTWK